MTEKTKAIEYLKSEEFDTPELCMQLEHTMTVHDVRVMSELALDAIVNNQSTEQLGRHLLRLIIKSASNAQDEIDYQKEMEK
jgi:hypothetical protein